MKYQLKDFVQQALYDPDKDLDTFLHISVKAFFDTMTDPYTQTVCSVNYTEWRRNLSAYKAAYGFLKKEIPEIDKMRIADLLQYVVEFCLPESMKEGHINREEQRSVQCGIIIMKSIMIDTFRLFGQRRNCTYETIVNRLNDNADD